MLSGKVDDTWLIHDQEAQTIVKELSMRVHRISKYVQGVICLNNAFLLDRHP
mgnify:CR=1 FL=1